VERLGGSRRSERALQYDIGNGLAASKMTRYHLAAALYAPLFEDDHGRGIFEYDKPSSHFGPYGDGRVMEGRGYLDAALVSLIDSFGEQLSQVFMLRVFDVDTAE
jgi:hypothetical protein